MDDRKRVFLLSPANASGARAKMLLRPAAGFDLARKLQGDSAEIGEVFAFVSGLYFRGKLAYSQAFANPPDGVASALVITAGRGLLRPDHPITMTDFRQIAEVPIDLAEPAYRLPFERDAELLARDAGPNCDVILLGSIATPKYMGPLLGIFGERLLFPASFVGRGDMSRGGLMLRCARSGEELTYVAALTAERRGCRPARLPKLPPRARGR